MPFILSMASVDDLSKSKQSPASDIFCATLCAARQGEVERPLSARAAAAREAQELAAVEGVAATEAGRKAIKAARGSRMWAEHEDRFILKAWCRCCLLIHI